MAMQSVPQVANYETMPLQQAGEGGCMQYLMGGDVDCSATSVHHHKGVAFNKGDGLHLVLDDSHGSCFWLIQQNQAPAT